MLYRERNTQEEYIWGVYDDGNEADGEESS